MAKQPQVPAGFSPTKKAVFAVDPDVRKHEPLSWGLRWLDLPGEWGWRTLNPDHIHDLHGQLVDFEGNSLHDLLRSSKAKDIPVKHIKRAPRERLKEMNLEEAETLWELRLSKKWRVWGLIEGSTFHVLWWDEFEAICNPPPKGEKRR